MAKERITILIALIALGLAGGYYFAYRYQPPERLTPAAAPSATASSADVLAVVSGMTNIIDGIVNQDTPGSPFPWLEKNGDVNPYAGYNFNSDTSSTPPFQVIKPQVDGYLEGLGFTGDALNTYSGGSLTQYSTNNDYQYAYSKGPINCIFIYPREAYGGGVFLDCGTMDTALPQSYRALFGSYFTTTSTSNEFNADRRINFGEITINYTDGYFAVGTMGEYVGGGGAWFIAVNKNGAWDTLFQYQDELTCQEAIANSIPIELYKDNGLSKQCYDTESGQDISYADYAANFFQTYQQNNPLGADYNSVFSSVPVESW
ncbi:MAG: hypothetical protein M1153_01135 [Patescibacteria group bacterium]|nr:hypothetical protein [Patescibacteria group bacterium]